MNNGKVRIYELSKELNLENKDILAVCQRLNISAKSHSSTITESEAELIRTTAENLPHSPSKSAAPEKSNSQSLDVTAKNNEQKKQQILEIRKPKRLSEKSQLKNSSKIDKNLVAIPPNTSVIDKQVEPVNRPRPNSSLKSEAVKDKSGSEISNNSQLKHPNKDSKNNTSTQKDTEVANNSQLKQPNKPLNKNNTSTQKDTEVANNSQLKQPNKPLNKDNTSTQKDTEVVNNSQLKQPNKPLNKDNNSTQKDNPEKETVEVPKLVAPPARPAPPSLNKSPRNTNIIKPSPKNKKPKPEGKKRKDREEKSTEKQPFVSKKDNKDTPQKDKDNSRKSSPVSETSPQLKPKNREKPTVKLKQVPEKKPQLAPKPKPTISVTEESTDKVLGVEEKEQENNIVETVNFDLEKPRRKAIAPNKPTLAKSKKGSKWEEEEEDPSEIAQKNAAKSTAKAKRLRPKPVLEDEDEELEELLNKPAPVTMSLSLARPAKPKSFAENKPQSSSNTSLKKKSSQSRQSVKAESSEPTKPTEQKPVEKLLISGSMTVQELASALAVPDTEVVKRLFIKGIAVNITESLDIPTIEMVVQEEGIPIEIPEEQSAAKKTEMLEDADMELLQRRPPVVTIMGHVDHGKTSLLDSIRATKVAAGEAGGITQHIGAYHVDVEHEGQMQQVVFLDTPGHEAFTAMRARGARVTDVAILVVAADDGVQPQTIEAISHAKAAEVPLIVAINKIDKEESNPDRVKQELMEHGLVPEEWGGDAIMVPVSAIKKQNLDTLLEMILLVSEVEDLNANPERLAKGTVIEANLDKARGPVATLLVQNGTLKVGDIVVAGSVYGKVRAMIDDRGDRVEEASPSFAVEVLGLRDVPQAGDEFEVFKSEKEASAITGERADAKRESRIMRRTSLGAVSARAQEGELKELNLILKGDVQGSLEAIVAALRQLPQKEVQLRLLLSGAGEVTETDIDLAAASEAVIIGFNTTMASGARQAADEAGVDVREYDVIYKLLDDVQGAMEGLLDPELVEEPLGEVEVRAVFTINRGAVAGCYVLSGKVVRNCKVRVRRNGEVIHQGILDSLRRMKDDVKEVNAGYECGISFDNFNSWNEGDIIEGYQMVTKRRKLSV